MKKTYIKFLTACAAGLLLLTACNRNAEAVLFEDKSTVKKADKSAWTATADSETPDGWENTGKASATIDGDINTYWHTNYESGNNPDYPHWILIDMKEGQNMVAVDITNRQAGGAGNTVGMKRFKLEGSNDGSAFTSLGEFNFAISNGAQSFPVSSEAAYRYLKVTALEPQRAGTRHTFLAEIDVFVVK
ncbi:MAG TPA: discoidin domain-containing protein [Chitinophagaceae bacterium]|nr:discoidin domain-containing protein [Chitinophagaceae bacterium]